MTPPEMTNQRRYDRARVGFDTEVTVDRGGVSRRIAGRFVVLGGGGAFVELSDDYPIGTLLNLRFKIPSAPDDIACRAIVRSAIETKGVGVEFLDISPVDRERIVHFIQRQLTASGS